jgi:NAD(P)H-hydrate epimerase
MSTPIVSIAQMRQWEEATWAAGRTEAEVISRVGHIVTAKARHLTRPGDLILVLAGKGHNGDDARHAAQNLNDREVFCINVTDPAAALREFRSELRLPPALILDGLFGIGLNRPLSADWVELVEAINATRIPVLAIDVPSGLDADTGEPLGAAVRATVTLTLAAPKSGLLNAAAWAYVGRMEVAPDIGLVAHEIETALCWTEGLDFTGFPPTRSVDSHKGTYGHLGVLAGSLGYHGAAVLAIRGALRARPGLVTAMVPESVYIPVASQIQAAMVHPWQPGLMDDDAFTALLIGPGLANFDLPPTMQAEARRFWQDSPNPVVVDASALDWLPEGETCPEAVRVITPHPGEAARLLGATTADIQRDRPNAVRELSRKFGGCWVVLKGHQTLVGRLAGRIHVNSSGNPGLAQGGSGDVLAGYVAGLLAQGDLQRAPETVLRYAAWQHGAAADALAARRGNWTVEDLVEEIG